METDSIFRSTLERGEQGTVGHILTSVISPMYPCVELSDINGLWNFLRIVCREEELVFFSVPCEEMWRFIFNWGTVVVMQLEGRISLAYQRQI